VPLYFAVPRRNGMLIMHDDERMTLHQNKMIRFRTLGRHLLTGAAENDPTSVPEIIAEMRNSTMSEPQGRAIDHHGSRSMAEKNPEGYF
jgi:sulfate adenylyltransferase subunit 2